MSRRSAKGFTLIEISVVVVVIGVLSSIVVPRLLVAKRGDDYRKSIQRLESVANACRDLAVSSGRTYVLSFDAESQILSANAEETDDQGSTTPTPNDGATSEGEGRSANLGQDWRLVEVSDGTDQSSDSQLEIRFFADGTSEAKDARFEADDIEVHLTVRSVGTVQVRRGASTEETTQEWEAGDLEQRTN